jgi:chemotaxis signal transduction protein
MANTAIVEATRPRRVLVFAVDDGCFCLDLDWVEAVYQRDDTPLHQAKDALGTVRGFLIHRGQPALVVDLREALDLNQILGLSERAAFLVVRVGSFLIALQVDACVGVRSLDLGTQVPVPTNLLRDGGLCVGHLVDLDGKLHTLLEPSRILSSTLREGLEPFLKEALGFCDRQNKLAGLVPELQREPTVASLKTYARLSRRNGWIRTATAARLVLKAVLESEQHANGSAVTAGELAAGTLLRDLVGLSAARQTGEVRMHLPNTGSTTLFFDAGRIADAHFTDASGVDEWGPGACKRILAARQGSYGFVPSDVPIQPQRIEDATLWLLVETIEHLSEERRVRRAR